MAAEMNLFEAENQEDWHAWLVENHLRVREVWLVYRKQEHGKPRLQYEESVEEALCFGWVDSLIKSIDDEKYARKFTPRRPGSHWSELNVARVQRMIDQGRMTENGLRLFGDSKSQAKETGLSRKEQMEIYRQELMEKLDYETRLLFKALPPSLQGQYAAWVMSGKKEATRQKRMTELSTTLTREERLGLK